MPDGVILSSASTFSYTNITSVVWNTNSNIHYLTFAGCKSLQTVTINNCGFIHYNAFGDGCTVSTFIINMTTPPTVDSGEFFTATGIEHIYVPAEAVDEYMEAYSWNNYDEIIAPIENMPEQ